MRRADLQGRRFGRLVVEGVHSVAESPCGTKRLKWSCRCDCGRVHAVRGADLTNGVVRSCGCLLSETSRALRLRHGQGGTAAGGKQSREYRSWAHAKKRCSNPAAKDWVNYGGRGIRMCQAWSDDFAVFFAHMGQCPRGKSLDRIDVNGHYEPGNCRWATAIEQASNTRASKFVIYNGERMTVAEASRRSGIPWWTVHHRIYRGWSIERALSEPVRKSK